MLIFASPLSLRFITLLLWDMSIISDVLNASSSSAKCLDLLKYL